MLASNGCLSHIWNVLEIQRILNRGELSGKSVSEILEEYSRQRNESRPKEDSRATPEAKPENLRAYHDQLTKKEPDPA